MIYKVLVYTYGGIIEEMFEDEIEAFRFAASQRDDFNVVVVYRMVNGEWKEVDEMDGMEDE